jgi:hypothetical protein
MNLQETWNKLNKEKLNVPGNPLLPAFKKHSRHPVQKLIRAFQMTLGFSVAFGLFFIALLFVFEPLIIRFFLGLLILAYFLAFVYNFKTYKKLQVQWDNLFDTSLKEAFHKIHHIAHSSIRFQEKVALYLYPISITGGFLMGLFTGNNTQFERNVTNLHVLIILGVCMIIFTPVCYYLAKWMYKVSYDKYLQQLTSLVEGMDQEG